MKMSTNYCKLPGGNRIKSPKLSELHQVLFGEGFENTHDALADVRSNCCVVLEIERVKSDLIWRRKPENYKSLQTEYGKMPPQAVDLEGGYLGSLMLEKDAFITVSDFFETGMFLQGGTSKDIPGNSKPFLE